jgi:hypothetical protein
MGQARCGVRQQVLSRLQAVASNNTTMGVDCTPVSNWGPVCGVPVLYGCHDVRWRKGGKGNSVRNGCVGELRHDKLPVPIFIHDSSAALFGTPAIISSKLPVLLVPVPSEHQHVEAKLEHAGLGTGMLIL